MFLDLRHDVVPLRDELPYFLPAATLRLQNINVDLHTIPLLHNNYVSFSLSTAKFSCIRLIKPCFFGGTCVEIKMLRRSCFVADLHAIDAMPARSWRCSSSPLDGASTAVSSPRNDLGRIIGAPDTPVDFHTA